MQVNFLCWAAGAALMGSHLVATAQVQLPSSPPGQQALNALVGASLSPGESIVDPAPGAAVAGAATAARQTVIVRRGETLDAVIRRTLGDQPFKDNYLRSVFVDINPQAFPDGSVHRLAAGASLRVHNQDDLRRPLLAGGQAAGASRQSGMAPAPSTAAAGGPDKRHWIRFP